MLFSTAAAEYMADKKKRLRATTSSHIVTQSPARMTLPDCTDHPLAGLNEPCVWDTEYYKIRSTPHTPLIWWAACILLSDLIVMKPVLPVALSVTWMPNWLSDVPMN